MLTYATRSAPFAETGGGSSGTAEPMPNKNGRRRVEKVALELFAKRGVAETTTRTIAQAAGLAEGTLYRHFATKEELAVTLFLDAAGRLLTSMEEALEKRSEPEEQVPLLVHAFFQFAQQHPNAWHYLMHGHPPVHQLPPGTRLPKDVIVEIVRRGIARGTFTASDPLLGAAMVIGMAIRTIFFLKQGLLRCSAKAACREVGDAALRALGTQPNERRQRS